MSVEGVFTLFIRFIRRVGAGEEGVCLPSQEVYWVMRWLLYHQSVEILNEINSV